ncbi:hypothetical protein HETIRDRAFT_410440 [Heterobasidion irregulare TC 32-1]|uniref:Uncharacterized protein n=1 Tax=Heterobasidion irregulare (strain TC 32-1) TaxID=747525 RepID=W4K3X0_HETIT|nr:uncharacterized protein HETIRDRAFT_410440 [Heterobasidion irregulare TC 32-1]ETW79756.1 hypothetical protein HETIRDRAFT_410440 [Heterobasidion irregulare TC 32-1]
MRNGCGRNDQDGSAQVLIVLHADGPWFNGAKYVRRRRPDMVRRFQRDFVQLESCFELFQDAAGAWHYHGGAEAKR